MTLDAPRPLIIATIRRYRKVRTAALLLLAAASSVVGGPAAAAEPREDAVVIVQRLEVELSAALNKYDVAALARLWDEDLTFVFPNGAVASKAERIAGLREVPVDIPQSENESVQVKTFGNVAVAVVVSRWPGMREGKAYAMRFRATHVWVSRAEGWKLVCAHVGLVK